MTADDEEDGVDLDDDDDTDDFCLWLTDGAALMGALVAVNAVKVVADLLL